ncbi:hypothetical protein ASE01_03320 [Nocardioides sp. Root190]|nr:hypothetical protein ASE01_03320 [Nocardioides sp. Root190]
MLLPLGVVSVSWTLAVAGAGLAPVTAAGGATAGQPEMAVPESAVESPASLSESVEAMARPVGLVQLTQSTTALIPTVALAAYQRAETIIGGADEGCGLDWSLLAAIGKVESSHGSANGSRLDDDGRAVPGIVGIPLDGTRSTASISDTDGGRLDGDRSWDRAVGPLQFIPSTWAVVGVDADDDGERNPQDIDDAALAAAVYLCSGNDDLSSAEGRRAAVLRYNHSQAYADLVLDTARSYAAGGARVAAAGRVVPQSENGVVARSVDRAQGGRSSAKTLPAPPQQRNDGSAAEPGAPAKGPRPGGTPGGPTPDPAPSPAPAPVNPPAVVTAVLTTTQAILACTLSGLSQLLEPARFRECVASRTS